ncbi:MAG: efflux RND transporter permease subunit [Chthoniobacterales bacterium]
MHFTDLFIKRPVLALVVNLLILLAGYESIHSLNVREYPRSDVAIIQITTAYVGANADLVRGYITTPLERIIAAAEGIDYIESSSVQGLSAITVHLKLNQDPNTALTQIQAKMAQVHNELPPEAQSPIITLQNADDQRAAMYIGFSCENLEANQITDFLTRVIQPKLTAIDGIQKADVLGARVFAMRVWLKPDRLAALGVSASDVSRALQANNYVATLGKTKGSMTSLNLVANTNLTTPEEFKQLVVKEKNSVLVRLQDIADVELGAEDYDSDVRFDGKHANFIGIWALPSANVLDVIKRVRAELPALRKLLPQGMTLEIPYDSTLYIQDAITEVLNTLLETLGIVILVIFLFLGSLRSVLIPVIAIPISLIGAALIMILCGFTINLLTLLAIVLAVGLVVDDAIVVVENIERHLHEGLTPIKASLQGARELVGPIIAMTITLAAVYTPIGIQGGLTGALFREFAFTLAGAVFISGVVALTLSPMMSSRLLRQGDDVKGAAGWINQRFAYLQNFYARSLELTLHYRAAIFVVAGFWILILPFFYLFSSKELAPKEDQSFLFGIIQTAPNATLDQTLLYTKLINDIFFSLPETTHSFQVLRYPWNIAGISVKPWSERKRSTDELAALITQKAADVSGVRIFATTPPALPGTGGLPVEFVISSTGESSQLVESANKLVAAAFQSGLFIFADSDLKFDQPQVEVSFDRNKVSTLGLDLQQVGMDLGTLFGGNYVNRFSIQGRSYKVIPQIKRKDRLDPDQLKKIYVTGPNKQLIQLSTFATLKQTVEPRELKRFEQLNSATISGILPPGVTIDAALKILEKKAAEILPRGYVVDYSGESRQLRTEGNTLIRTLLFSFILIFLVLSAQFESFRDPFIILFGSVPLALSGALLFSFLGFTTINIYSQVGLITLVGLVSKNGILIVDFANRLQAEGMKKWDAIIKAASTRLRPILMTSVATVAGHFPLILARGPGAGARNSIGIVLVTGMIIGTLFTLFVVPSFYLLVSKEKQVESNE